MTRLPRPALRTSVHDDELARLDPRRDARRMVELMANHVFPLDIFGATELGQFRTFSIPSISRILHQTGEYERNGVRRIDDTRAFLVEILSPGPTSPAGEKMIDRLRAIHSYYRIRNDDYIYTLSVFVVDPIEFINRHGWRPSTPAEQHALYVLYRQLGERMGVRDIPNSYDALATWRRAYEVAEQRHTAANEAVARGLIAALAASLPGASVSFVETAVAALVTDRTRTAVGLRAPPPGARTAVLGALKVRKQMLRAIDPWSEVPFWQTSFFQRYPSYPSGYDRMRLGPDRVLAKLAERDTRVAQAATNSADTTRQTSAPTPT